MSHSAWLFCALLISMVVILFLILKVNLNAAIALVLGSILMGILSGITTLETIDGINVGFGNMLKGMGLPIGFGIILGELVSASGGAKIIADKIVQAFPKNKAIYAIGLAAFVLAIPVYFDVTFVILIPIGMALMKEINKSIAHVVGAITIGAAAAHTMVPPTPAPLAAGEIFGFDTGLKDERLGMGRQPARVVDGSLARLLVTHRGVGKLKLLDTRTMLVVDYHGAVLGVHVHTVDAPAERPTGILDLELVERKLQVARGKGGKCLGLVGKHALQLRQDLGHLALLHRRERHQRALRAALAGVLGQRLVKDLVQQLLSTRQILGRHALHAFLGQTGMQMLQHVVDKVALLHVAKASVDRLGLDAIRDEPA